jgi:transcriptional regulator with XRE-family HTH domain
MVDYIWILGKILKALRQREGLSQAQLSIKATVDRSKISRIELGYSTPRLGELLALCSALNRPAWKVIKLMEHESGR